MLRAFIVFFVLGLFTLILGLFGFGGLSIEVGKLLLVVFVILTIAVFLITSLNGKKTYGELRKRLPISSNPNSDINFSSL
jgi:hypothetical protein